MIGIIGYGTVGKAVEYGFSRTGCIISDPKHNKVTVEELCEAGPSAIFVCVPTPTDDSDYKDLKDVLKRIANTGFENLVVVKSTILPKHLEGFDVVYNPEFLSRATANDDFVNPPFVLIGGNRAEELVEIYRKYSTVNLHKVMITDIKTAAMAKYVMNTFYATKITFMNQMYDVAQELEVNWSHVSTILANNPWMGTHHFQVPGPDGHRGFGGPCLPKDTEAILKEFDVPLLDTVMLLNKVYRQ